MSPNTQEYDNEMKGALFPNKDKKTGDKRPNMTGPITIEGKTYQLAGWSRVSRNGEKYMSLKVTDPDNYKPVAERGQVEEPDELPF